MTPIYKKWCSLKSGKLQRSHRLKSQSVFTTHACNWPYCITTPLYHAHSCWHGIFNPIDHCTMPGQFSEEYSIAVCMAMLLSNYHVMKLIFSFATFQSASFFINRCQTWSIHGLWRKMRYQNVDEKLLQILTPHTSADFSFSFFFFFKVFIIYSDQRQSKLWPWCIHCMGQEHN